MRGLAALTWGSSKILTNPDFLTLIVGVFVPPHVSLVQLHFFAKSRRRSSLSVGGLRQGNIVRAFRFVKRLCSSLTISNYRLYGVFCASRGLGGPFSLYGK